MKLDSTTRWRSTSVELFLLRVEDVSEDYVGWLNDPEVNRYLESRFVHHTVESTRSFVASCLEHKSTLMLGIRSVSQDMRHVGNIKIGPIDTNHGLGEIGILVGERSAWGKGIATEAIRLIADIAQHELCIRKLSAGCYGSNVGSEKAFVKAGFVVEGRRVNHFVSGDQFEDLVLMGRHLLRCSSEAP